MALAVARAEAEYEEWFGPHADPRAHVAKLVDMRAWPREEESENESAGDGPQDGLGNGAGDGAGDWGPTWDDVSETDAVERDPGR